MNDNSKPIFILLLLGVAAWGVLGIHIVGGRNGFFDLADKSRSTPGSRLPGTKDPLLKTYSGFEPLDGFLTVLTIVFQTAIDGLSPSICLFSLEFYGQVVALTAVLLVEGLRAGNRGRIVSFVGIFGMIYQTISVGFTIPVYWALSLLTSPAGYRSSAATLTLQRRDLYAIPPAIVLGFTLPTILMALPVSIVGSTELHQKLIAAWQFFPLYVSIFHFTLTRVVNLILPSEESSVSQDNKRLLKTLRVIYTFAIFASASAHIACITLATSVELFPMLFQAKVVPSFKAPAVFLPPASWLDSKVSTLSEGFLVLLQYDMYAMSLGSLVWAIAVYRNAQLRHGNWEGWILLLLKTVIATLLLGPIAAVVILVWERDETVLGRGLKLEEKKGL